MNKLKLIKSINDSIELLNELKETIKTTKIEKTQYELYVLTIGYYLRKIHEFIANYKHNYLK